MEIFKLPAQVNLTHIPYSGSAGAVKDLLSRDVPANSHHASPRGGGQIRILTVGSKVRAQQAKQVPTLVELGMVNFDVDLWFGALAPAGAPKEIVDR